MDFEEAIEWLRGKRSMTNLIPQDPLETWQVRIAEADAAMTQQAYWIVKAYEECEKLRYPGDAPDMKCTHPRGYIKSVRICGLCGEQLSG